MRDARYIETDIGTLYFEPEEIDVDDLIKYIIPEIINDYPDMELYDIYKTMKKKGGVKVNGKYYHLEARGTNKYFITK
ncbi:MAG: hypothetical protein ABH835_02270 [Patescibacteria group bacterium]